MPSRLVVSANAHPGNGCLTVLASHFSMSDTQLIGGGLQAGAFGYAEVTVAVATVGSGLMWANMLRAFQVGKARTSHVGPWSWMRESRVAWVQVSWPACHLTKASASAVM